MDEYATPPSERLPLTTVQWGVGGALALTALATGITLMGGVFASALRQLASGLGLSGNVQSIVMGGLLTVAYLVVIAIVWIVGLASGSGLSGSVGLRAVPIGATMALALAVAVGARLFAGVYAVALQLLGVELPGQDVDPTTLLPEGVLGVVFTVLIVCVLAPIAEEMVFRGVLLSALAERYSDRSANLVSSAVFAAVHVLPFAIPPIFVFALLLGRLYIRSRSLWVPIAAHALFNAIGIALVYVLKAAGAQ